MATGMAVKHNTKTYSDKPAVDKDLTAVSSLTPEDKAKIGSDDLKAVLNKAANKDWADPSKKVAGHGDTKMDKDAFFKLMLAQLKNQDPMNPLKNHEMAAQLAQFSSLEQMTNMNTTLSKMESKNAQPENFQALNLIGKTVAGDASRVVRSQFDKEHDFNFTLPMAASEANVKVLSAKGDLVREYKLTNLVAGPNKVAWNGANEAGDKQAPGEYVFQIEAKNNGGQKIPVNTEFSGEVTGLSFAAEGPVLQVGSQSIKMKDVRRITDSSAKQNGQILKNETGLDLKNSNDKEQTNIKQEANTSPNTANKNRAGNGLSDIAMSRELLAKLQKETVK